MDNGIYIALGRQTALLRDMEVTAGNIANANTTGYTAERISFASYLAKDINQGESNKMAFGYDVASWRDTADGPMSATGNALDVAVQGNGYFIVETPLGERYTRAGNFQVDSNGTLITADGYPVLDNSGQNIIFPDDTISIEIGGIGNIKVNGEDFATLGIVEFENEQMLERLDGRLFKSELPGSPAENARVFQGTLEGANVRPVAEMTHMMKVSRAAASTAKLIETIYDLQRKTAEAWSRQG